VLNFSPPECDHLGRKLKLGTLISPMGRCLSLQRAGEENLQEKKKVTRSCPPEYHQRTHLKNTRATAKTHVADYPMKNGNNVHCHVKLKRLARR